LRIRGRSRYYDPPAAATAGIFRHRDVKVLRDTVKTKLNIEMAGTEEMIGIALDVVTGSR